MGIIKFLKKFIFSAVFIYSFDLLTVSLNFYIPINFFTILLISFLDVPAFFCLILFFMLF